MDLPDVLIDHPDGEIRVKGSRIGLHHVINLYQSGHSPEQIAIELDTISLFAIRQAIDFYEANRDEVDRYMADYRADLDRIRSLARPGPSRAELLRRMEEMKRQAKAQ